MQRDFDAEYDRFVAAAKYWSEMAVQHSIQGNRHQVEFCEDKATECQEQADQVVRDLVALG